MLQQCLATLMSVCTFVFVSVYLSIVLSVCVRACVCVCVCMARVCECSYSVFALYVQECVLYLVLVPAYALYPLISSTYTRLSIGRLANDNQPSIKFIIFTTSFIQFALFV